MKELKICGLFLMISLLVSYPQKTSSLCGGGDDFGIAYYSFFSPILNNTDVYKPLFFTFERLYDYEWTSKESKQQDNLQSWGVYFKNQVKEEAIQEIVYSISLEDMQKITDWVRDRNTILSESLQKNEMVQYLANSNDMDAADYLCFAKKCEPHTVSGIYYWDEPVRDKDAIEKLIIEGKNTYSSSRNPFLKLRYAYQVIRLTHYIAEPRRVITEFTTLINPLIAQKKIDDLIFYWSLGHYAGALRMLGNEADAAYYFSIVFDKCPSKRIASYYSFKITSDESFSRALAMCRTNREKTSLYLLRAINPSSNSVEEMNIMYSLDQNSDQIELLLVREINKLESSILNTDLSNNLLFFEDYKSFSESEQVDYLRDLKNFTELVIKEGKVKNILFWQLADTYLDFLNGSPDLATKRLDEILIQTKDTLQIRQIQYMQSAIEISTLKVADEKVENELYTKILAQNNEYLTDFYTRNLERLYTLQGEKGKSFLCYKSIWNLAEQPEMEIIDDLLAFSRKSNKTLFEKKLLGHFSQKELESSLLEMKATSFMGEDKLSEAIAILEKLPENEIPSLSNDPFGIAINDCYESCIAGDETKLSLAKKLLELKEIAKGTNKEAMQANFLLGNAYYNMTWFGNAWESLRYYRSTSDLWYYSYSKNEKTTTGNKNIANFDCSKAESYYLQAVRLADKNRDKETAAKATFMAAKCEQNRYYISDGYDNWSSPVVFHSFRTNFEILKSKYKKTKFYKQAMDECKYFNTFVNSK